MDVSFVHTWRVGGGTVQGLGFERRTSNCFALSNCGTKVKLWGLSLTPSDATAADAADDDSGGDADTDGVLKAVVRLEDAHSNEVNMIAAADGDVLVTFGDQSETIATWDLTGGGALVKILRADNWGTIAVSSDARMLAVPVPLGSGVHIINVGTEQSTPMFEGHKDTIENISFSHDGTRLVTISADHKLRVWNMPTGALDWECVIGVSSAFAISKDGGTLVVCGPNESCARSLGTGHILRTMPGNPSGVGRGLAVSSDGTVAVWSGNGADDALTVWGLSTGNSRIFALADIGDFDPGAAVTSVAFSPDNLQVLIALETNKWTQHVVLLSLFHMTQS